MSIKEDLDTLYKPQIRVFLGVDETLKWYNRFVLIPKAKGKVHLCLDLARLTEVLIRHVH